MTNVAIWGLVVSEAFPKVVILEELPIHREYVVEIAGVRCRAVTTVTSSSSPTPRVSLIVSPLDAAEGSSPLLRVEVPFTDQPTWNLCSWQSFLTQTIGAHPPAGTSVTAAPVDPTTPPEEHPEAPPATHAAAAVDTGSDSE